VDWTLSQRSDLGVLPSFLREMSCLNSSALLQSQNSWTKGTHLLSPDLVALGSTKPFTICSVLKVLKGDWTLSQRSDLGVLPSFLREMSCLNSSALLQSQNSWTKGTHLSSPDLVALGSTKPFTICSVLKVLKGGGASIPKCRSLPLLRCSRYGHTSPGRLQLGQG
jgi:hypothetical protein